MSNPHAHPHTMRKTHAKFENNWYKTVRGVALTRDTHCLYNQGEKWLSSQCRKSDKNWSNNYVHPTCTSSYHVENTCKFQNNGWKSVRGVALTRETVCLYNQGEKWLSSQCRKSDKNWSNNYVQSTCTSSYHQENTCKVSKQWVENCKRSCPHKIPMLNVDGWTDGQMDERTNGWKNGRKLARLCLPAKAGATKIRVRLFFHVHATYTISRF